MEGLYKILIKEKNKIIGLGNLLTEEDVCTPTDFFVINKGAMDEELMTPTNHHDEMKAKLTSACEGEDVCFVTYYDYYKNEAIEQNITPETPTSLGCAEAVEGEEDESIGPCGGAAQEKLWSYQLTQGWKTDTDAQTTPCVDKSVDPEVKYPNGIGATDWGMYKTKCWTAEYFLNDTAVDDDKCKRMPLYAKNTGREINIDSDRIKTKALEEYCWLEELEDAGDGSWPGFYMFEYSNGLSSCLINNWTYVRELGIDYNMGRDKCFESVKVPGTAELQGAMGYEFPVNRKFYRINKECVKASWKNKTMKVDPYKNYGGKDRVQALPQRTKQHFERANYNPYGSGQSSQSSVKQDIRSRLTGRYADVPLNIIDASDDSNIEDVVIQQDITKGPNPLEKYGDGYFDDVTII